MSRLEGKDAGALAFSSLSAGIGPTIKVTGSFTPAVRCPEALVLSGRVGDSGPKRLPR